MLTRLLEATLPSYYAGRTLLLRGLTSSLVLLTNALLPWPKYLLMQLLAWLTRRCDSPALR